MDLLIFGQTGQVSRELARVVPDAHFLGRQDADLTDPSALAARIRTLCQRRSKNRPCGGANVGHLRVPESGTRNAEGAQVPALSI